MKKFSRYICHPLWASKWPFFGAPTVIYGCYPKVLDLYFSRLGESVKQFLDAKLIKILVITSRC
jgi:hypothetical protein